MNSTGIRWAAIAILLISFIGFIFGGSLPIPLMAKFFLGAFGFGSGVALLIVAKVLRVKQYEVQASSEQIEVPQDDESPQR